MENADFIETYPAALPPDACAALIARFETSGQAAPGRTGEGVVSDIKRSRDITISGRPDWRDAEEMLNRAMFAGLVAYLRKYPYVLLSPLSYQHVDPDTGKTRRMVGDDVAGLDDDTLADMARSSLRPGSINLQHYLADSGGYPTWHCESSPGDPNSEHLHRVLLWTIYLNEGFAEGETEFLYQQRKIVPRTGTLLIAPTAFTHTHRGNKPGRRDKYIATSWVLFKRFETILGNPK
jgi:hypothetical protein